MVTVIYDYITNEEVCRGIKEEFNTIDEAEKFCEDLRDSDSYCNIDIFDEEDLF